MRLAGHVACMDESRGAYRVLVRKPEGNRPRHRWRIVLRWIFRQWDEGAWTGLIWLRIRRWWALVYMAMIIRVPYNVGISWLAENWLAFQEGLCFMELVSHNKYISFFQCSRCRTVESFTFLRQNIWCIHKCCYYLKWCHIKKWVQNWDNGR